jgi:hypothetical protein
MSAAAGKTPAAPKRLEIRKTPQKYDAFITSVHSTPPLTALIARFPRERRVKLSPANFSSTRMLTVRSLNFHVGLLGDTGTAVFFGQGVCLGNFGQRYFLDGLGHAPINGETAAAHHGQLGALPSATRGDDGGVR